MISEGKTSNNPGVKSSFVDSNIAIISFNPYLMLALVIPSTFL